MESNPIRTHSETTRLVKAQGELSGLLVVVMKEKEDSKLLLKKIYLLNLLSCRKFFFLNSYNVAQISVKSRKTSKYVLITKYFKPLKFQFLIL